MPSYKDFRIFGKTGTTKLAGKCFAGFTVRGNEKWKIILLGSNNVFDDMKKMLDSIN
jgi:D-alanyl-D-alanine carboxypeptidase